MPRAFQPDAFDPDTFQIDFGTTRLASYIPDLLVELSLADPGSTPVWQDITADVRHFAIDRGRTDELEEFRAGTGVVMLDNRQRQFDPLNEDSPYYPDLVPMRRVRVRTSISTGARAFTVRRSSVSSTDVIRGGMTTLALFTGYVETWPVVWDRSGRDSTVSVVLADGFKPLNLAPFKYGYFYQGDFDAGEDLDFVCGEPVGANAVPDTGPPFVPDDRSDVRISRVLDCVGWLDGERDFDEGEVWILGSAEVFLGTFNIRVDGTALDHIQDVALAEAGAAFVTKEGHLRFIKRGGFPSVDEAVAYGSGTGEIAFQDVELSYDDDRLWNQIEVGSTQPDIVASFREEDATSIERYFPREKSISLIPSTDGQTDTPVNEGRALAGLARYKDPRLRITKLTFRPTSSFAFRHILERELAYGARVNIRLPSGDVITQDSRLEGINIVAQNQFDWLITWRLSAL
jgi:hypothetical protein